MIYGSLPIGICKPDAIIPLSEFSILSKFLILNMDLVSQNVYLTSFPQFFKAWACSYSNYPNIPVSGLGNDLPITKTFIFSHHP